MPGSVGGLGHGPNANDANSERVAGAGKQAALGASIHAGDSGKQAYLLAE